MKQPKALPDTLPILGNLIELSQNITRFHDWMLEKSTDTKGAPWAITVPGNPAMIVISTPDLMEDVLKTQCDVFPKGDYVVELTQETIGDTILMQSGDVWRRQRKVATKFFTPALLREVAVPLIREHADGMYKVLHKAYTNHTVVNLTKLFDELTLNLSSDISFGLKLGEEEDHSFHVALDGLITQIFERFITPKWMWKAKRALNLGSERTFRHSLQVVHDKVSDIVSASLATSKERQANGSRPSTIIEMYIDNMDDQKPEEQLSEAALRDIAIAFILGGRDTMSSTLQWLFLELLQHKDIYEKLIQALSTQIPHVMNGTKRITLQEAQSIPYLEAVIKETLRMHPAITISGREASRDTTLSDGTFVSKGSMMLLSNYTALHLNTLWGPDAHVFKPERWLDPMTGQFVPESPFKMVAFNAGPRMCVGMSLALLELRMMIIGLLARFQMEASPNDGTYTVNISLVLKDPLMVRVTKDSSHLFEPTL